MNGLFLGFAKVGGRAWLRGSDAREHAIYMGDSSIHFKLEKVGHARQSRGRGSSSASEASESLYLSVCEHSPPPGVAVRWQDQESAPLEKQLAEIIIGMAVAGEHLHRQWIAQHAAWERKRGEREEREAQRRREEAEQRERERLAAIEKAKVDGLVVMPRHGERQTPSGRMSKRDVL